jgi:hypothetical protein
MIRRRHATTWVLILAIVAVQLGCGGATSPAKMTELQRVKSGTLDLVLLSPDDALRHGKDTFVIEFRSNGNLVDVGNVRATANMPMPGMPMFGNVDVQRTSVPGRYAVNAQLEMAGTWRMTVEWDGPTGKGSVTFSGTVQ